MNQNEFVREQQAAVERMREMNARAQINTDTTHRMPPAPSFVRVNENRQYQKQDTYKNKNTATETNTKNNSTPLIQNQNSPQNKPHNNSFLGELNIPFLDNILKDGDSTLIIGLLLILMSEKSDKMLLFALVYILL